MRAMWEPVGEPVTARRHETDWDRALLAGTRARLANYVIIAADA